MKIFVDTSGWACLFNRRDKHYQEGARAFESLAGKGAVFVTTDYVIDETLTNLQQRVNHHTAENFGVWVLRAKNVRRVHINDAAWNNAWAMFRQYDDKEFSFTDCTSFVIMRQQKLIDAFCFDHHFEQMGFRLWPR